MIFETLNRKQTVVLWTPNGFQDNGEPLYASPIEVKQVRFETGRRDSVSPEGDTIATDGTLYTSRDIPSQSVVWEGKLADLPDAASNLYELLSGDRSPAVNNKSTNRAYALQRWKDSFPVTS